MKNGKKRIPAVLLWVVVWCICFCVLTRISFSDGDDAFYAYLANCLNFTEYIRFLYETWTSCVFAEAVLYVFLRGGHIWLWRFANATMLTLLPYMMTRVVLRGKDAEERHCVPAVSGIPSVGVLSSGISSFAFSLIALCFYVTAHLRVVGYSCIWVTGSLVYLTGMLCSLVVLEWLAKVHFTPEKKTGIAILPVIFCAVASVLSIEQMGAVLITLAVLELLHVLGLFDRLLKKAPRAVGETVDTQPESGNSLYQLVVLIAFLAAAWGIVAACPGNKMRLARSVQDFLPEFYDFTFSEKLFITTQWLLSSFANENALIVCGLFLACLLDRKHPRSKAEDVVTVAFLIWSALSASGWKPFSDMGIDLRAMTGLIEHAPRMSDLTAAQGFALALSAVALVWLGICLWRTSRSVPVLWFYLASIAAEAVLAVSPTIYASGERLFFTSEVLLYLILLWLAKDLHGKKQLILLAFLGGFGVVRTLLSIQGMF